MKEKQFIDFCRGEAFLFRLGRVCYQKAHAPLSKHVHGDCVELVFMMKGRQTYQVGQEFYTIYGGEVFLALPDEEHSTGGNPEEKAGFYYLIINVKQLAKEGYLCLAEENSHFLSSFEKKDRRVRKGRTWYGTVCRQIWLLCQQEEEFVQTKIRNLLSALLLDVAGEETGLIKNNAKEIDRVLDYIHQNIQRNLDMEEIAEIMNLSVSRFKAVFTEAVGIPPREYIVRKKLQCCEQELAERGKNITEIAYEYGFSSSQYFSTVFKRYYNVSPSVYQKGGRKHDEP